MGELQHIYEVPSNRRYWLVRSDGGKYYDHFIKYGCIALGYLNRLELETTEDGGFKPNVNNLKADYLALFDEKTQSKASTQFNQVKRFLCEMAIGDWVITVGKVGIRYGVITSDTYIENDPAVVEYNGEYSISMEMNLRRRVKWGPIIRRGTLPYGLSQALRARLAVTSLDRHWQALHHSIYPAFRFNGNLYLSIKITTEEAINNYSIMSLFKLLSEIEVIGKEFNDDLNTINFDKKFDDYHEAGGLTVTTKAQFHSPGDVWAMVQGVVNDNSWLGITYVAYSMLFGNKLLGVDGVVDIDTRHKIRDLIIDRIRTNKAEKELGKLGLQMPQSQTDILEVPVDRQE